MPMLSSSTSALSNSTNNYKKSTHCNASSQVYLPTIPSVNQTKLNSLNKMDLEQQREHRDTNAIKRTSTHQPVTHSYSSTESSTSPLHALPNQIRNNNNNNTVKTPINLSVHSPPREMLTAIRELQEELQARTDSVNAIQRNFERLSQHYNQKCTEWEEIRERQIAQET